MKSMSLSESIWTGSLCSLSSQDYGNLGEHENHVEAHQNVVALEIRGGQNVYEIFQVLSSISATAANPMQHTGTHVKISKLFINILATLNFSQNSNKPANQSEDLARFPSPWAQS